MTYRPYASPEYYQGDYHGNILPEDEVDKYLRQASRHIDALTFNRIVGRGISSLTGFQQDIVREVVCEQAEFEYQNRQGYSINGISMQFGESWNVTTQMGIPMRRDIYEKLKQTGLCSRLLR